MRPLSVLLPLVLIASAAFAQGGAEGPASDAPPKNAQIYKGKTVKEIQVIMKTFTIGLGVKCSYCHAKDYASDEKAEKKTAREMIRMLDEMNEKYSMLEKKGTCYMCHHGNKEVSFTP
jgi:predicted metal-binding protein